MQAKEKVDLFYIPLSKQHFLAYYEGISMHLILVPGFLGSGKTSFIIKLAKRITHGGKKVAILVNEIGEIGIDDQLMRQLELNAWEVMGGCICCTLSGDLVTALQQIDANYDVDIVILEPSGAAEPGNILNALPYYRGRPLESIHSIAVLDPLRISELYQVLTPLVTNQLQKSEQMIITKADLASEEELENAKIIAREINPSGQLFVISSNESIPDELLQSHLQ